MRNAHAKRRVLVVDDNQVAADSLARLLELWGHEADAAYDEAALELAARRTPDVVLLDLAMPRMAGTAMARELRQAIPGKPVLIIAITGYHDESIRRLSQQAGIDHHLIKPVDLGVLATLLAQCAAKR
jgi:CheY-like chemotaxis protein